MQKIIGIICLVLGIMLLVWAHNIEHGVNSQITEVFTGTPSNRAMYFYIGGTVLGIVGVWRIFRPTK